MQKLRPGRFSPAIFLEKTYFAALMLAAVFYSGPACAQSWVQADANGNHPPNDSIATTYFPYTATLTSGVNYGGRSLAYEVGDIYVPNYGTKPVPANSTSRPAVIVIHGGGGASGSRTEGRSTQTSQLLAAHGCVAFNIDYDISTSKAYPYNAIDFRLAVRWLRANAATYGIDPNHIGITGGSFGGFAAALVDTVTNGQHILFPDSVSAYNNISLDSDGRLPSYSGDVQCALDFYGPTYFIKGTSGGGMNQFATDVSSTTCSNASPIYYAHAGSPPLMICHGTADATVNISYSYTLTNYLAHAGAQYVFDVIPGAAHTFYIWDSSKGGTWPSVANGGTSGTIDLRKDTMDFFDKWLLASANPPYISIQPTSQSGCSGYAAGFSVTASGTVPLHYQWVGPTGPIVAATNANFTIANLNPTNGGNYSVVVTNNFGSVTSSVVTLTVNNLNPPNITAQPVDSTVLAGNSAGFTVVATGDTLQYQWYGPNGVIPNATNATYTITNAANINAGAYQVIVHNACNSQVSDFANLFVNGPPTITGQPVWQNSPTCLGTSDSLIAAAIGTVPLSYQWYGPSGLISGANSNVLTLTNLTVGASGNYYLIVTNSYGTGTSSNASLTVSGNSNLTLTSDATNFTANVGGTATFSVSVSGGGNYTYLWLKNDYDTIPDSVYTNATLVFTNVTLADAAYYHCFVYNDCSSVASANATLTVTSTNSAGVVIAEVYAAGGKTGAIYTNDFVVLKNTGAVSQSLNGWSLQHQKAGTWQTPFALPNVAIPPGGYYLIKCYNDGSGITASSALPTPDASTPALSAWNLSITGSGAVALVNNVNSLTTWNNTNIMVTAGATNIVDVVGYVATTTTNSYIGSGVAPGGSITNSTQRLSSGCQNTPNNALDFVLSTPTPRNSSTAPALCFSFAPPSIVTQPQGQSAAAGSSVSLAITANGSAPLAYQWRKESNTISGATSPLLNISPALTNHSGNYDVVVSNPYGAITSSIAILLITNAPPAITQAPQGLTILAGASATFSVTASGTPTLSYQWRRSGVPISGANGNTYTLSSAATTDSGSTFDVVISNNYGSVTSSPPATLTVNAVATSGTVVIAEVYAGGGKTGATYNRDYVVLKNISINTVSLNGWSLQHDKVGVWQTPFALPNASIPPGGYYLIQCYDDGGTAAGAALPTPDAIATQSSVWNMSYSSADAVALVNSTTLLTSCSDPSIIDLVGSGTTTGNCYLGTGVTPAGASAVNGVTRLGNGCQNSGDNSLDFAAAPASPKNSATTPAPCAVPNQPPTITTQPLSHVTSGPITSFGVSVAGTAPFAYQWFTGATSINGATNALYVLSSVTTNNSGNTFYVVITNMFGAVTSVVASLTVNTSYNELLSLEAVKAHYYLQTNTSTVDLPVASGGTYSWAAEAQGILPAQITGSTVSYSGTNLPNPFVQSAMDNTGLAQDEILFGTKNSLDAAFNNGNYHYVTTFDSGNTYVNDLPLGTNGDAYPNVPTLTAPAGDWSAGKLNLHAVTGGYQISWVPMAAPKDQINIAINDAAGNPITELDGLAGTITNYVLPGGILDPNKDYQLELTFTHMNYLETNTVGTVLYGLFEANNDFTVHTDPAGVGGSVQVTNYATIRNGSNSTNDINEQSIGYVMAKYSTNGASAKAYLQFNLAGANYDATMPATLRLSPGLGGGSQRIQVWALNQAFSAPTNFNSINWNQAPANDTNGNDMLTSGPVTASLLADLQLDSTTNELILPAPWGQFVFNDQLTLVLGTSVAIAGDVNSSAGFRVAVTNGIPLPTLRFSSGPSYTHFLTAYDGGLGLFGGENFVLTNASSTSLYAWSSADPLAPVTSWALEGPMNETPLGTSGSSRYGINLNPGTSPVYYIFSSTNAGLYTATEPLMWLTTDDYVTFISTGTNMPISTNGVFAFATAPSITQEPVGKSVLAGQSVAMSVVASGSGLSYQWRFNNTNLSGANASSLMLSNVTLGQTGPYSVRVDNTAGAVTSSVAFLNVSLPPAMTLNPVGIGVFQLGGISATGLTYIVESATNLATSSWIPVFTNSTGNNGVLLFQTNATPSGVQFFRVKFP